MPSMARLLRLCLLLLGAGMTTACASTDSVRADSGTLAGQGATVKPGPGGIVKIGNPYKIGDRWYYPADDKDYEETGVASWYGPQFHAKSTANGETFDMNSVSAAHRTLPMPSYVEVTNLNNGRQLVVRVNDRGPFAKDRIIDLSRRAAQLLGFDQQGTAPVRVRRVYPDADGTIAPALPQTTIAQATPVPAPAPAGQPVPASAPVVQTALPPSPYQQAPYQQAPYQQGPAAPTQTASAAPVNPYAAPTAQPARAGMVYIQVAALSDNDRADTLALNLRRFGTTLVEPTARGIYRVQIGPFDSRQAAEIVLAEIRAAGYSDARVTLRPIS